MDHTFDNEPNNTIIRQMLVFTTLCSIIISIFPRNVAFIKKTCIS